MVFHADGFRVSFLFYFFSILLFFPHYEKMMSKPPTDAIAVLHTHSLRIYTNPNERERETEQERRKNAAAEINLD